MTHTIAPDVPLVLVKTGGRLTIRDAEPQGAAIDWPDPRPRVFAEPGATVRADDSVIVVR